MSEAVADTFHHEEAHATARGVVLFLLAVVVIVAAVVYGIFAIGPWVLGVTALATVPLIYIVLVILTMGQ